MEKVLCKVCGGDMIKNSDGDYICQGCSAKVSQEEMMKMASDIANKTAENVSDVQTEPEEENSDAGKKVNPDIKKTAIFLICFWAVIIVITVILSLGDDKKELKSDKTEYDNPVYYNVTNEDAAEGKENIYENEESDTEGEYKMTEAEFSDMIEQQLSDLDYVEVGFRDGNVFTIGFCFNGTAAEVGKIQYGISDRLFWNTTKNFVNDLYKKVKNLADIYGFEDYSIGINVINDMNHSKSLLVSLNGSVVYDCLSY